MNQCSGDLCERLLGAIGAGPSHAGTSRLVGFDASTISRWQQQCAVTGTVALTARTGRRLTIEAAAEVVHRQVAPYADATLAEHCAP